jgi:hypothetical protein
MVRRLRYAILLSFLFAMAGACAKANTCTTCYIDYSSGNDSNSGADKGHPWKHAPGMTGQAGDGSDACASNCASQVPKAGDQYILRGGVVWPYTAMPFRWTWGGSGSTSAFGCTGTGCIYIGVDPSWNSGQVNAITLQRDLGGCKSAPTVAFSGGGGSGATAHAVMMPGNSNFGVGFILYFVIDSPGSGYTSNPTVTVAGGGCRNVDAVADIQRAVFDYGLKSRYAWDYTKMTTGAFSLSQVSNVIIDNLEARNLLEVATSMGGSLFGMLGGGSGNITYSNNYVHNLQQTTRNIGQPESTDLIVFNKNGSGKNDSSSIHDNYANNAEPIYLSDGNNCRATVNDPCSYDAAGIYGGGQNFNNHVYGARWLQEQGSQGANPTSSFYNNEWWLGVYSCCGGHANALYILPQTGTFYIHENVLHDIVPGMSAFYLQMSNGTTWYVYNNVIWNIGTSTNPIGIDVGNGGGSGGGVFNIFNNTMVGYQNAGTCVNNNAGTYDQHLTVILQNNQCITTSTPFFQVVGSAVYKTAAGSTQTSQLVAPATNSAMTMAAAAAQGYTAANLFAPTQTSAATVMAGGSNFYSSCHSAPVTFLGNLCVDINGTPRPSSGSWNTGAYFFSGTVKVTAPKGLQAVPH